MTVPIFLKNAPQFSFFTAAFAAALFLFLYIPQAGAQSPQQGGEAAETPSGIVSPPPARTGQGNYGYFRMQSTGTPAVEKPEEQQKPEYDRSTPQQIQPDLLPQQNLQQLQQQLHQQQQQQQQYHRPAISGTPQHGHAKPSAPAAPATAATQPQQQQPMLAWRSDAGLHEAEVQMSAGQYAQVVQTLRKVAPRHPHNADAHAYLGQNLLMLGMKDEARRSLSHALKADPQHMGAHLYMGLLHLEDGKRDLVVEHLNVLRTLCGGALCQEEDYLAEQLNAARHRKFPKEEEEQRRNWLLFWR